MDGVIGPGKLACGTVSAKAGFDLAASRRRWPEFLRECLAVCAAQARVSPRLGAAAFQRRTQSTSRRAFTRPAQVASMASALAMPERPSACSGQWHAARVHRRLWAVSRDPPPPLRLCVGLRAPSGDQWVWIEEGQFRGGRASPALHGQIFPPGQREYTSHTQAIPKHVDSEMAVCQLCCCVSCVSPASAWVGGLKISHRWGSESAAAASPPPRSAVSPGCRTLA